MAVILLSQLQPFHALLDAKALHFISLVWDLILLWGLIHPIRPEFKSAKEQIDPEHRFIDPAPTKP